MLRIHRVETMCHASATALDRSPRPTAISRTRDHAVITGDEDRVRSGVLDIPQALAATLQLDCLPGSTAVDRTHNIASFTHSNAVESVNEAGAVGPCVCRDSAS